MTTTIFVTQTHINNGHKNHCRECPIALALKETFPEQSSCIIVRRDYVFIDAKQVILPYEARQFIANFDFCRKPVKPFSFELNLNNTIKV